MNHLVRIAAVLAVLALVVPGGAARAATLYWSGGTGAAAGNGTWSTGTTLPNYWADATSGGANVAWTDGNDADFYASGASVVTVSGSVAPNSMTFTGTGYALTGGTINLGAGGLTVNNSATIGSTINLTANQAWTLASGTTLTLNGATNLVNKTLTVNGAGSIISNATVNQTPMVWNSTGTLTLGGSGDNSGFGLTVNAGTVLFAKTNSASGHAIGGPGVTINGGLVQLTGTGGDQIYDHAGGLRVNAGTFDLNGRSEGVPALVSANTTGIVTNSSATAATLTLGAGAYYGAQSGTYAGTISGNLGLTVASGTHTLSGTNSYTGETIVTTLTTTTSGSGSTTTTFAGTLKLASATALGSTAAGTTVVSGGVLDLNGQTVGAEPLTLNGTGITGTGALINSSSTAASLGGNVTLGSDASIGGTGAVTLSGVVSGGYALTKVGANTLTLSGVNAYSGGTTVVSGILKAGSNLTTSYPHNNATSLGTGAVTVQSGATLDGNAISGIANAIYINGTGASGGVAALTNSSSSDSARFSGKIYLQSDATVGGSNGNIDFNGGIGGSGSLTKIGSDLLYVPASTSNFTVATIMNAGTLAVAHSQYLGTSPTVTVNGGTLRVDFTGAWFAGTPNVTVNSGGTVTTNGGTVTIGALTLNGGILSGTRWNSTTAGASYIFNGTITHTGNTTSTVGSAATATLSGGVTFDVADGASATDLLVGAALGGSGTLAKTGSGTLTLSGANTFAGGTTVSAGRLLVNGANSGGGAYTVASAATLGGSGSIGASSLALSGTVSPGSGAGAVGTLATGAETWSTGSTLAVDMTRAGTTSLPGTPGTDWDLLNIAGGLTLASGATYTVTLSGSPSDFSAAAYSDYSWIVASTTTGIGGFADATFLVDASAFTPSLANAFGSGIFAVAQSGNDLVLTFTAAVPEPSTQALAAVGLVGLFGYARRRRRSDRRD
jgi:fibronectin-binding autotransporter adhesin